MFAFENELVLDLISANFIVHESLHIVVVNFSLDQSGEVHFLALDFIANLLSELGKLLGEVTLTIVENILYLF